MHNVCALIHPRKKKKGGPGLQGLVDPGVRKGVGLGDLQRSSPTLATWWSHLMILLYLLNLQMGFQNYQYPCDILQDWAPVAHVFENLCINKIGSWAKLDHQSCYLLSVLHTFVHFKVRQMMAKKPKNKGKYFQIKFTTLKRPVMILHMSFNLSLNRINSVLLLNGAYN